MTQFFARVSFIKLQAIFFKLASFVVEVAEAVVQVQVKGLEFYFPATIFFADFVHF